MSNKWIHSGYVAAGQLSCHRCKLNVNFFLLLTGTKLKIDTLIIELLTSILYLIIVRTVILEN